MTTYTLQDLAKAVIATADKHENSWDSASGQYRISIAEAASEHPTEVAQVTSLMLYSCWNDALDWARQLQ